MSPWTASFTRHGLPFANLVAWRFVLGGYLQDVPDSTSVTTAVHGPEIPNPLTGVQPVDAAPLPPSRPSTYDVAGRIDHAATCFLGR